MTKELHQPKPLFWPAINYQAAYKQWRDWMMLKWLLYMRLDGLFKLRYITLIILNFILNKKSVSAIESALYMVMCRD